MRGWATLLLADHRTWLVAATLATAALIAARPLARSTKWPLWPTLALLLSIAVIASLTLTPAPGHPVEGPTPAAVGSCLRVLADPPVWWQAVLSTDQRGERIGNLLMFVPAGCFAVLATRRPLVVALLGSLSPVAVEISQALLNAGRRCAADDWVNNASGALLGVLAGWLASRVSKRRSAAAPPGPSEA